ncbi:hypothetical protein LEP1GSC193_3764 [Leptospira alstonii serovar Pingchang str. 80-412]|uniref:Uncharacterized protein n=2 Tax=Leptospira alstonii TaxID=28452 RepID=M6CLM3_9LEPT|nr:hypothetical protein LEP1GSC194_2256 [Leptospira alstonii serovar Sichuan str. 79601]EQA80710.1 hypothetical protein LEP1GSC193_3764 [Leptospira alstonii serovar Pingchang str. 80-412]
MDFDEGLTGANAYIFNNEFPIASLFIRRNQSSLFFVR